jgi:GNAT superfamily N-acetyltransferase
MWLAFNGPQRHFTVGDHRARRFAPGFSPIILFPDRTRPDFDAIAPYCQSGEQFYVEGWNGAAPAGWRIDSETPMVLMALGEPSVLPEAPSFEYRRLTSTDVPQMLDLIALTLPGPFGPRTHELGEYLGVFEGERLLAMAGERFHVPGYREISAVCTEPGSRGKGYARGLMGALVRRQLARAERPFLHVMAPNLNARALYRQMGFIEHHTIAVRVVEKL